MRKFFDWLDDEARLTSLFWVLPSVLIIKLTYEIAMLMWLESSGYVWTDDNVTSLTSAQEIIKNLILGPFLEELIFRVLPIMFLLETCDPEESDLHSICFMFGILASSFCFGISHGNKINVLFQGVAGVIYLIIFLKYGGMSGGSLLKPLMVSTLFHGSFNGLLLILVKIL